jgi:hypothetical protein
MEYADNFTWNDKLNLAFQMTCHDFVFKSCRFSYFKGSLSRKTTNTENLFNFPHEKKSKK